MDFLVSEISELPLDLRNIVRDFALPLQPVRLTQWGEDWINIYFRAHVAFQDERIFRRNGVSFWVLEMGSSCYTENKEDQMGFLAKCVVVDKRCTIKYTFHERSGVDICMMFIIPPTFVDVVDIGLNPLFYSRYGYGAGRDPCVFCNSGYRTGHYPSFVSNGQTFQVEHVVRHDHGDHSWAREINEMPEEYEKEKKSPKPKKSLNSEWKKIFQRP